MSRAGYFPASQAGLALRPNSKALDNLIAKIAIERWGVGEPCVESADSRGRKAMLVSAYAAGRAYEGASIMTCPRYEIAGTVDGFVGGMPVVVGKLGALSPRLHALAVAMTGQLRFVVVDGRRAQTVSLNMIAVVQVRDAIAAVIARVQDLHDELSRSYQLSPKCNAALSGGNAPLRSGE